MKKLGVALAAVALGGTWLVACGGGHPGGTVGDPCTELGSSDECLDDEICDAVESGFGDEAYCLRFCSDQEDCDVGEACNGVSNSSEKACHPKFEDEPVE